MDNSVKYGALLCFLFFSCVNTASAMNKNPELFNQKLNKSVSSISTQDECEQEYNKALLLTKTDDREKGIKILKDIAEEQDFLAAKKELAFLYSQNGNTLKKSIFWRKSVYQDTKDAVIAMQIGATYKALYDNENAKKYFLEAKELNHPFAERALKELND